jgi:glucose-6-phosphate 1-dehydrogenase
VPNHTDCDSVSRATTFFLFAEQSQQPMDANQLVIQIQLAEGIQLYFRTKVPDSGMRLRTTDLDFRFADKFSKAAPEAYQRLLLDAMLGDAAAHLSHRYVGTATMHAMDEWRWAAMVRCLPGVVGRWAVLSR